MSVMDRFHQTCVLCMYVCEFIEREREGEGEGERKRKHIHTLTSSSLCQDLFLGKASFSQNKVTLFLPVTPLGFSNFFLSLSFDFFVFVF